MPKRKKEPLGAVVVTMDQEAKQVRITSGMHRGQYMTAEVAATQSLLVLVAPVTEMEYLTRALSNGT
jgi:hypothetical protein